MFFLLFGVILSARAVDQNVEPVPSCNVRGQFQSWVIPPTPNGLVPNQCWLSVAASPDGDVFITGSDHKTNAALYKLDHSTGNLLYVGDARHASESAHNWEPGETAEKFHMRPIFYEGLVYLATADFTDSDAGYLNRRGFHWYCYDSHTGEMSDLSESEPGGVGGAHASIVAAVLDEDAGVLYAISTPTCELYRYDIGSGRTSNLGRAPSIPDELAMPGRYIWMGQNGRVYFTVSSVDHVLYYDPSTGFDERKAWKLAVKNGNALVTRTGAEVTELGLSYMVDEAGRIYRYDRRVDDFALLGQAVTKDARYLCGAGIKMRAFNVTADGGTIYFINDGSAVSAFWKWEVVTGKTVRLCDLSGLDEKIGRPEYSIHAGNDSWGQDGCFYFCSFGDSKTKPTPLILSRVNPSALEVRMKEGMNAK